MAITKIFKDYIKTRPRLYDLAVSFFANKKMDQSEVFFDRFSRGRKKVNFIQVGANDGLRWDPIRRFVVRDKWCGIFVEPIPDSFKLLKKNYSYIKNSDFVFVNAAVGAERSRNLKFWTCSKRFLDSLPLEDKMYYLRLASFDKEHLKKQLLQFDDPDEMLDSVDIPCLSLNDIVSEYWVGKDVDLLVIDAEGYESSIIPAIDFNILKPQAVFYESHNLADEKQLVENYLKENGYKITEMGGDTLAEL